MKVSLTWKEKMQFTTANALNKVSIPIDSPDPAFGGEGKGEMPKHMFLQSIGACSAMDVVSILTKMHAVMPDDFRIEITGEQTETQPKVFTSINLRYIFNGGTEPEKIIKAVGLSQEKYCGLSIMIKKIVKFSFSVELNSTVILSGE